MQISEPAEYALLGLLQKEPMHGYEMFQQFERATLGEIVHLEMSQMYAFLKKLERLEYIEAEIEARGTRPPRKVYHLKAQGREVFRDWLLEPVEKPRDIRILFLIKLYFLQRHMPEQAAPLVRRQEEACQRFLLNLEQRQQESAQTEEGERFLEHVVLRSRIYQTRALLAWLQELSTEMSPHIP
ncbi:PadR family transcriptional regulator [Ktedonospora formicarum]|uniref:PadR family transcriptional regulator n=1 Tax=Ktedonospora formicarum TaxID=2778364 RepID=A0A8J3I3Z2_9CHLR|nr:PadR family transcriptional regulator [Ktedonospora formicarum]GHO44424.1 PadR family transcriptional regulator [Ktedonospora formicarum]